MKTRHLLFTVVLAVVLSAFATAANAQEEEGKASIKFDRTNISLGTFSDKEPVQKCVFTFRNKGDAPLVINQAIASCGCTVPKYTKQPVAPGETGQINVTYNGKGKFPGHFKKTITVRTNGDPAVVRLYIEGDMKKQETTVTTAEEETEESKKN